MRRPADANAVGISLGPTRRPTSTMPGASARRPRGHSEPTVNMPDNSRALLPRRNMPVKQHVNCRLCMSLAPPLACRTVHSATDKCSLTAWRPGHRRQTCSRGRPGDDVGPETGRVLTAVAHQPPKAAIVGDVVGPAVEEAGPLFVGQRPGGDDLDRGSRRTETRRSSSSSRSMGRRVVRHTDRPGGSTTFPISSRRGGRHRHR